VRRIASRNCFIVRSVLRDYPTDRLPRLPDAVQALVDEPPLATTWVSEVHATALYMAICDAHFTDDDAYVTFSLKPDGSIDEVRMKAVSPLTDFSFDWYPLFTPVSKKSHPSCTTRATTAGSSKS